MCDHQNNSIVLILRRRYCPVSIARHKHSEFTRTFTIEMSLRVIVSIILEEYESQGFGIIRVPGLEHSNSLARCVAIIATGMFVFLTTTYYQTLLLSMQR